MLFQRCPNVATMLPQCGLNVAPVLPQCCPIVAPMLAQRDPTLRARISTALIMSFFSGAFFGILLEQTWPTRVGRRSSSSMCCPQWPQCGPNVAPMLPQGCPNVATLLPQCGPNVAPMLPQCGPNVAPMLAQCGRPNFHCIDNFVFVWGIFRDPPGANLVG